MPSQSRGTVGGDSMPARFEEEALGALEMRVSAEFREMPGLTLTLAQASRLLGIEAGRCERVLRVLVVRGVLVTDGQSFARADVRTRGV